MVDDNILNEIIDATNTEKLYHVRVESSEDGVILDIEVPAVLFLYADHENFEGLTMRGRGINGYEVWGWLEWALTAHKYEMMETTETPPPLENETEESD